MALRKVKHVSASNVLKLMALSCCTVFLLWVTKGEPTQAVYGILRFGFKGADLG